MTDGIGCCQCPKSLQFLQWWNNLNIPLDPTRLWFTSQVVSRLWHKHLSLSLPTGMSWPFKNVLLYYLKFLKQLLWHPCRRDFFKAFQHGHHLQRQQCSPFYVKLSHFFPKCLNFGAQWSSSQQFNSTNIELFFLSKLKHTDLIHYVILSSLE